MQIRNQVAFPFNTRENAHWYLLVRRSGGRQTKSWHYSERHHPCCCWELNPVRPTRSTHYTEEVIRFRLWHLCKLCSMLVQMVVRPNPSRTETKRQYCVCSLFNWKITQIYIECEWMGSVKRFTLKKNIYEIVYLVLQKSPQSFRR
jgi:hypothetical protein